jgi:esterase/lipase
MKMILRFLLLLILALVLAYLMGPKPPRPKLTNLLPSVPSDLNQLENQIREREKSFKLKPDNEARFIWANDSLKAPTEFALLYLHGFSACWYEGYPVNVDFARHFGCNAYFPRMASHGIDTTDALVDMTPERLWESAKEALVIARQIGRKVVIISSSTGGTLSLKLAAEYPELVFGLILYSPNIAINNSKAWMLSRPWGLQFSRQSYKSNYRVVSEDTGSKECYYWNCKYRLEAVVYLQQLLEATMRKDVFQRVKVPVFLGYYYKDEQHQDKTVRVDAALKMFDQLGTQDGMKQKIAFPEAGDHLIACEMYSKSLNEVRQATFSFARDILGMKQAEMQ